VYLSSLAPGIRTSAWVVLIASVTVLLATPFAVDRYLRQVQVYQPRDAAALTAAVSWLDETLRGDTFATLTAVRDGAARGPHRSRSPSARPCGTPSGPSSGSAAWTPMPCGRPPRSPARRSREPPPRWAAPMAGPDGHPAGRESWRRVRRALRQDPRHQPGRGRWVGGVAAWQATGSRLAGRSELPGSVPIGRARSAACRQP
jgi:hypothetical protein